MQISLKSLAEVVPVLFRSIVTLLIRTMRLFSLNFLRSNSLLFGLIQFQGKEDTPKEEYNIQKQHS